MKKLLLASAVAALSVTAAQAAPQVYGKIFLTADYQKGSEETVSANPVNAGGKSSVKYSNTGLNSNASRIGVRGSEPLTANTDVLYQLEYRLEVDNNGTGGNATNGRRNFESRDTYLGLSNKQYGTVLAGRLSAIDSMIDYANVATGGVIGGDGILASFDGNRVNNAVAYVSPLYNNMTVMAMYGNDSDQNDVGSLSNGGWGVAVKYEPAGQPFRGGASYIHAKGVVDRSLRVSGSYDINPALTVGALYQDSDLGNNSNNEKTITVSAQHKTATPWTAYGQVDLVDNVAGRNSDAQRLVVGGKYAFNKVATGHVYTGYQKGKNVTIGPNAVTLNSDGFGLGAGLEYKF